MRGPPAAQDHCEQHPHRPRVGGEEGAQVGLDDDAAEQLGGVEGHRVVRQLVCPPPHARLQPYRRTQPDELQPRALAREARGAGASGTRGHDAHHLGIKSQVRRAAAVKEVNRIEQVERQRQARAVSQALA